MMQIVNNRGSSSLCHRNFEREMTAIHRIFILACETSSISAFISRKTSFSHRAMCFSLVWPAISAIVNAFNLFPSL